MNVRITKYNPLFRESCGRYIKDEWNSCWDIGRTFNGKPLSLSEYMEVEGAYVGFMVDILDLYGIRSMNIACFELYDGNGVPLAMLDGANPDFLKQLVDMTHQELRAPSMGMLERLVEYSAIGNGRAVGISEYELIFRLCLREILSLRLVGVDNAYVHIGSEYYVFMGTDAIPPDCDIHVPRGMFVEHFESPYLSLNF